MKHPFLMKLALAGWCTGLFVTAVTAALVIVFGGPDNLKSALNGSGAYTVAADTLSQTAIEKTSSLSAGVPLAKTEIEKAAHQTFTPQAIRGTTEKAVDGTYDWLMGETETPQVRIDTSSYSDKFAKTLTGQLTQQTGTTPAATGDTRPACSQEQLQQIFTSYQASGGNPNAVNIDALPCSPATAVNDLIGQSINQDTQQKSGTALEDSLKSNALPFSATDDPSGAGKDIVLNSKAVSQNLDYLPALYTFGVLVPWLFGILAVICAVCVILLTRASGVASGIRSLARSLLITGIILAVLAAVSRLIMMLLTRPDGSISRFIGSYGHVLVTFINALERKLDSVWFIFGIAYIAVAALALIYLHWQKKQKTPVVVSTKQ